MSVPKFKVRCFPPLTLLPAHTHFFSYQHDAVSAAIELNASVGNRSWLEWQKMLAEDKYNKAPMMTERWGVYLESEPEFNEWGEVSL